MTEPRIRKNTPLKLRFWQKVDKRGADECWQWTGSRLPDGYGNIAGGRGKVLKAHRVSYELAHGPIPTGKEIDHLCRNRLCVNPDHLEAVTKRENILRGESLPAINGRKTHCPKGHPYSENAIIVKGGGRHCRLCKFLWNAGRSATHLPQTQKRLSELVR